MSTYYANDRYSATLTAGYSVGQTTLYVSAVPNNVPTIIVAAKGTDNETTFGVTGKTTNSLTGVSRLRGANVDLDAQTPLTCLNNEEFINQSAAVNAVFYEEHDETGKHTTDQINEKTEDAGVTVDGLKLKDGRVVGWDGWMPAEETWTYASATTFTISGDKTGKYQKGDKIKLTNSTVKYFYIIGVSYSDPNTTVTVTGGSDYALASVAITDNYYSKIENPQGFPEWFNYEASVSASGSMTISNLARFLCVFKIAGKSVTVGHFVQFDTGGTASNIIKVTLPVNAADTDYKWSSGARIRNTVPANSAGFVAVVEADKAYYLDYNAGNFLLTTNRQVSATFTYRF